MEEGSPEKKVTKKKLKNLRSKWIQSVSEGGKQPKEALGMNFSEVDGGGKKGNRKKKKSKPTIRTVGEKVADEQAKDVALDEVDLEMMSEMVQRVVNIEVERAIRELKEEIREQNDITRKEIVEQLKLEMETMRQEMEISQSPKRGKGLFERF